MPDSFARQLERLAPSVDVTASRELFDRERSSAAAPRWSARAAAIVLVAAGVVGLFWLARSTGGSPAPATPVDTTIGSKPDTAIIPPEGETVLVESDRFGVVVSSQTTTGFGLAAVADSPASLRAVWDEWTLDGTPPELDVESSLALVITRPDDACDDTLVRFEVELVDGVPQWTPVFQNRSDSCEEPLVSWLYVVTVPRELLADPVVFRVPGSETYGVVEQRLTYPNRAADGAAVLVESATGVIVELPPMGAPALHNTSAGLLWVVQHDDGSVSVLPATVERRSDDGLAPPLRSLVAASASGRSLGSDGAVWDEYGRSVTGQRSDDLVGLSGRVDGSSVEVWTTEIAPLEGEPIEPPAGEVYPLPDLGEPITPVQWFTLSSSGPIWRYLDAALVVEDGVGRICQVDTQVPAAQRATCDDAAVAIDTKVRSTGADPTIWFAAPILAFQDPLRGFTAVVPLGAEDRLQPPVTVAPSVATDATGAIVSARGVCAAFGPAVEVEVRLDADEQVTLVAVEGGEVLGRGIVGPGDGGVATITFDLSHPPGARAEVTIDGTTDSAPLEAGPDDCPSTSSTTGG